MKVMYRFCDEYESPLLDQLSRRAF